jgi:multidrug resistance efflux pump
MNIIETSIPDVTKENIQKNKEIIANNIIENVYPLFDEVYKAKVHQAVDLKKKIKLGKNQLRSEKEQMQKLVQAYKKEQKISKMLDRIEKLVQSGLTYDGTMKNETVILLKILDKLPEEKLDQQLAKTMNILNKRFSR